MIIDELMAEMSRITEQQSKALTKEADGTPELRIDESQFSMLEPEGNEDFNLMDLAFIENAVVKEAVDYDGQDKEILKEKKQATDHPDIIEQAHPETAYMADGPMGTGIVENQNEQHEKMLNVVQRVPSGFHYNKFARLVEGLTSMAVKLEEKGDVEAAKKIDALAMDLVKGAKSFLAETPAALNSEAADVPAPNRAPGVAPWTSGPPIPAERALTQRGPNTVLPPGPPGPGEKLINQPPGKPGALVKRPPTGLQPAVKPGPLVKRPTTGLQPAVKPGPLAVPIKSVVPVAKMGLFARLSRFLAGKGGKVGAVLTAIGAVAFLYEQLAGKDEEIKSNMGTISAGAKNPRALSTAQAIDGSMNGVRQALEEGKSEQAIRHLADTESQLGELAKLAKGESPEVQDAVKKLSQTIYSLGGQTNSFVNQGLQEHGETAKDDRVRTTGIQNFLREHIDHKHPVTGIFDPRTRRSLHDFVDGMKEDLDFTPKMLTVRNLVEYGTEGKLERLWDIWKRPHLYGKET